MSRRVLSVFLHCFTFTIQVVLEDKFVFSDIFIRNCCLAYASILISFCLLVRAPRNINVDLATKKFLHYFYLRLMVLTSMLNSKVQLAYLFVTLELLKLKVEFLHQLSTQHQHNNYTNCISIIIIFYKIITQIQKSITTF